MGDDRGRHSLFDRLPTEAQDNLPLLLDCIYGEMMSKLSVLETQVKGRLSGHEVEITRSDARLKRLENCPCAVLRDPAHTCVVMDIRDELAGIRADTAAKLGEIEMKNGEQLARINSRLSWWGGGLAVVLVLIEILSRLLPVLWR